MTNCNVGNRTIFCDDNIDVLRGINSECIDLIYLDPPFNKNKKFTAPIGSSAEGAEFSDIFREEDVKDEWLVTIKEDHPELYHYLNGIKGVGYSYNFAYLAYMAIRLLECHRVLKQTGTLYLHCDPTMSHYLKSLMDCIFGEDTFRNEIIWSYQRWTGATRHFQRMHDVILFYAGGGKEVTFNQLMEPYSAKSQHKGSRRSKVVDGSLEQTYTGDTTREKAMRDVWEISYLNSQSKERTGYPTQKPIALLRRILMASTNEGDLVLDPFCGCATTCVAAEQLGRQWIGIDVSIKAYELVKERLTREAADPEDLFKYQNEIHLHTDPPQRTDLAVDYRETKFVYVIAHPSYPGEYKVGIAKDWKSRLNAYQTSDPDRQFVIKFKVKTPHFRQIERHIHDIFPNKHEWVQGDLDSIIAAICSYSSTLP